ncbi:MAG: hypothetical protein NXI03_09570 [Alphaproteobacteria bacterium]|nr:hypothetical protein [Alphaproteobacteria bacterium]
MFSLSKIIVLGSIVAVIWYGFRLVGRLDQARKRKAQGEDRGGRRADRRDPPPPRDARDDVVDLVRDERTGEYVTRDKRDDRA